MFSVILVYLSLLSAVAAQDVYASLIICGVQCSDGSSWLDCYDAFGGIQGDQGDCFSLHPSCPNGLQTVRTFDFASASNQPYGTSVRFRSKQACQEHLRKLRSNTNIPTYSSEHYHSIKIKRSISEESYQLLDKYNNFDSYSELELEELHDSLLPQDYSRRGLFENNWKNIIRSLHSFYHIVKEKTDKEGVYTNSKCAGCSVMVQSLIDSGVNEICSTMQDKVYDIICQRIPETFNSFCTALLDQGQLGDMIDSICTAAISFVANQVQDSAVKICSELTCTTPQSNSVSSNGDISGNCLIKSGQSINERCEEFMTAVELAKKGICIAKGSIQVFSDASNLVSSPTEIACSLGKLCIGELPDIFKSADELIGCFDKSSKVGIIVGVVVAVVAVFIAGLVIYCCKCRKSGDSDVEMK